MRAFAKRLSNVCLNSPMNGSQLICHTLLSLSDMIAFPPKKKAMTDY